MTMDKIIVAYWFSDWEKQIGIKHLQEFEYTKRKRNQIIDKVLDAGLKVLIQTASNSLHIWVDDQRFGQR